MKELILKTALPWLVDSMKKQGFSWVLTALAVWFFYNQTQQMQAKIDLCNDTIIDLYKEDRKELLKVIQSNTFALENIKCK